jgi:hypothetical protein
VDGVADGVEDTVADGLLEAVAAGVLEAVAAGVLEAVAAGVPLLDTEGGGVVEDVKDSVGEGEGVGGGDAHMQFTFPTQP